MATGFDNSDDAQKAFLKKTKDDQILDLRGHIATLIARCNGLETTVDALQARVIKSENPSS